MRKMMLSVLSAVLGLNVFVAHAYDLSVSANQEDAVVSASKSYTIPKGTKKVQVLYNVYSAEYPQYVSQQSVYNDVWSLTSTSNGASLFSITRQVNSQLSQAPTWLPDSTTGDIKETVDVSSLTVNGAITIILEATSMNVGDDALTTTVSASIQPAGLLEITDATPDSIDTTNQQAHYGIAASGQSNTLQRFYNLKVAKAETTTVEKITVTSIGSSDLMKVVDQAAVPSGTDVTIVSQTQTTMNLKVRVTIASPVSTINGNPPPTRDLSFRFKVEGKDNGNAVDAEKTVTGRRALWRALPIIGARYGTRDAGGDDWVARGAFTWLQTHRALLTEIDDTSGEHGRDIGHASHQYGTDIDAYHFYRFPGATSGTSNYNLLASAAATAFGTLNATPSAAANTAFGQLVAFVTQTRTGLNNLAALNSVDRMYHCIGSATNGLPNGWARSLITTGIITRTVGGVTQTLNINTGAWSQAKVTYNSVHNNHLHVTLNRAAIGD
jgi:hypothetical protein